MIPTCFAYFCVESKMQLEILVFYSGKLVSACPRSRTFWDCFGLAGIHCPLEHEMTSISRVLATFCLSSGIPLCLQYKNISRIFSSIQMILVILDYYRRMLKLFPEEGKTKHKCAYFIPHANC